MAWTQAGVVGEAGFWVYIEGRAAVGCVEREQGLQDSWPELPKAWKILWSGQGRSGVHYGHVQFRSIAHVGRHVKAVRYVSESGRGLDETHWGPSVYAWCLHPQACGVTVCWAGPPVPRA